MIKAVTFFIFYNDNIFDIITFSKNWFDIALDEDLIFSLQGFSKTIVCIKVVRLAGKRYKII